MSASNTDITASITDSRGQVATASVTIEIYDYEPPKINAFTAHRCNQNGTDNNAGAYFLAVYDIVVSPLGNQNTLTNALKVKYKKRSASSYTTAQKTPAAYTEADAFSPIAVDTNSTYNLVLELTDDFGTTSVELVLPTAATRMNWGPGENGGIAIGKVNEYDKMLEIAAGWTLTIGGKEIKPVLTPSAAFAIPASGSSVSYDMDGLTADHEVARWNFSTSAENSPPVSLTLVTYDGYFTVTNNGGTTSETIRPVFVFPAAVVLSAH